MGVVVVVYVCYVFYDVPDDKLRNRIADTLKNFGLDRLQKSVFVGMMTRNRAEELALILDDLIGDMEADVRIVFVPPSFRDKVIVVRDMYSFKLKREEVMVV